MKLLSICDNTAHAVSEIVRAVGGNHERVIEILKELHERNLVELELVEAHGRGRPTKLIKTTPLGRLFVEESGRLMSLRLYSRGSDIKKALHQADLARDLQTHGITAYARFQEINELARNIARTAKTKQATR